MSRRRVKHPVPTRQQRRYRRLRAAGLCVACGHGQAVGGVHCGGCMMRRRVTARGWQRRLNAAQQATFIRLLVKFSKLTPRTVEMTR